LKTDYEKAIGVYQAVMRDKYVLLPDLERQWFDMACAEFGLDVRPLEFDDETDCFTNIKPYEINTLGYKIALYYIQRERSRINKLQGYVGKDISLTGVGQSKNAVKDEYRDLEIMIERLLHKQKIHSYN